MAIAVDISPQQEFLYIPTMIYRTEMYLYWIAGREICIPADEFLYYPTGVQNASNNRVALNSDLLQILVFDGGFVSNGGSGLKKIKIFKESTSITFGIRKNSIYWSKFTVLCRPVLQSIDVLSIKKFFNLTTFDVVRLETTSVFNTKSSRIAFSKITGYEHINAIGGRPDDLANYEMAEWMGYCHTAEAGFDYNVDNVYVGYRESIKKYIIIFRKDIPVDGDADLYESFSLWNDVRIIHGGHIVDHNNFNNRNFIAIPVTFSNDFLLDEDVSSEYTVEVFYKNPSNGNYDNLVLQTSFFVTLLKADLTLTIYIYKATGIGSVKGYINEEMELGQLLMYGNKWYFYIKYWNNTNSSINVGALDITLRSSSLYGILDNYLNRTVSYDLYVPANTGINSNMELINQYLYTSPYIDGAKLQQVNDFTISAYVNGNKITSTTHILE